MLIEKITNELKKTYGFRNKIDVLTYRTGFLSIYSDNKIMWKAAYLFMRLVHIFLGKYEVPPIQAQIGWGLRLPHGFKDIIINEHSIIGSNCTIYHNVTIGTIECTGKYPKIGNNVYIGCSSLLIGSINIGDNCKIGAGTKLIDEIIDSNVTVITEYSNKTISKN